MIKIPVSMDKAVTAAKNLGGLSEGIREKINSIGGEEFALSIYKRGI